MNPRSDIPLIDLAVQHASIRDEIDAAIAGVIDSSNFILGDEVTSFEREFARYCGCPLAVGCASGSDAILLALMACGVGPGDEVICPSYSFFATASAISRLGARPVFADIASPSYDMDPNHARALALSCTRLRAILTVDLFGQVSSIDAFLRLSQDFQVPLIEDAAQSVGARDSQEQRAGSRATIGCFSLYPSKNLGAMGDAGILTTASAELAQRLRELRVHGARSQYLHSAVGINSRLDALHAAVLRVKLPHLDSWTKTRRENAAYYDRGFTAAGAGTADASLDRTALSLLIPSARPAPAEHVYHQYVIRVPAKRRDDLSAHLRRQGIETAVYYPIGLHEQPCFATLGSDRASLPNTEIATRQALALPVHPGLQRSQLDRVLQEVVGFFREAH